MSRSSTAAAGARARSSRSARSRCTTCNITRYAQELLDSLEGLEGGRSASADAGQLDRSQRRHRDQPFAYAPDLAQVMGAGGPQGLHDPRRHAVRRDLHGHRGRASDRHCGRGPRCGDCGIRRRVQARQRHGSRPRDAGEEGHPHRVARAASLHRPAGGGVDRQLCAHGLRRGRRHGRAGAR